MKPPFRQALSGQFSNPKTKYRSRQKPLNTSLKNDVGRHVITSNPFFKNLRQKLTFQILFY